MPGFELLDVRPWSGGGQTRAFATLKLGLVTISGVRLIEGRNGRFVAGPSTKDAHGRWRALVTFDPGLEAALLAAFEAALAGGQK